MLGCIGRLISSALLMVAGGVLWHYREHWLPQLQKAVEERLERFESKQESPATEKPTRIGLRVAPGVHAVIAISPNLARGVHAYIAIAPAARAHATVPHEGTA